ncbi:hypothetical protein C2W64_00007 [Brevibacillus laterosporus]|nr:hypothetical protein [Brevibacillus laterosporus]RAP30840.1 hypothetical protein C2W64_00007 [Brevibacillus laterosporus]
MRKKIVLMLLSLGLITNIGFASVKIEEANNLELFSMRANNADPGY